MIRLGRRSFVAGATALAAGGLGRGASAASMGFGEARHLLSCTTFGPTPAEIRAFESLDYAAAVDKLLGTFHAQAATPGPSWANDGPRR